jgi:hypothetical protein
MFCFFFFSSLKKQLVLSLVSNVNKKNISGQSLEGRNLDIDTSQNT